MDVIISMVSDLIIIVFDLALYISLTTLKNNRPLYRGIMYSGAVLITAAYAIAANVFHVPYALASFVCMTIPSFFLFLWLSKYKNARFLVTFCFVDTVTFIIAAWAKIISILSGSLGTRISCIFLLVACSISFFLLRPYFPQYRRLMEQVARGWAPMAVSTVFIYLLLTFTAISPKPLITRMEYVPSYALLCVTILSFYGVFIVLIVQKAQLGRANQLLKQQQHWHEMAYVDELTKLSNPAAYAARVEQIEKEDPHEINWFIMIFDIDNFKQVNDSYGHHVGNEVLQMAADFFSRNFPGNDYEFFRIGGDEFAAIARGLSLAEVQVQADKINSIAISRDPDCTFSCGFSQVDFSENDPMQQAFIRADHEMYRMKMGKKE